MAIEEVIKLRTETTGAQSVKSLRQEIKETQAEAIQAARSFGEFSPEATKAAKRVAQLKDEMGDFQQRVAALNPDRFEAIATVAQGITGGITAATGAMALFGGESEEVNKILARVQGAIAFSQGVQQILNLRNAFGAVATTIRTSVVTAFSTLRSAILTTGIGALVVAAGILISKFSEMGDAAEEAATEVKGLIGELDKLNEVEDTAIDKRIAVLKGFEGKENEIFELEQQRLKNRIANIKELQQALNLSEEEKQAFAKETIKLYDQLDIGRLNFQAENRKKTRDAEKKHQEELLAQQKEAYEQRLQLEEEFQGLINDLLDEQDKEIADGLKASEDINFQLQQQRADGREREMRDLKKWYDEQAANQELTGQARLDLQELLRLRSLEIDKKYDDEKKAKDDAVAKEKLDKKIAEDKKLVEQEKQTQDALKAARQAGFDSASQLLGNISQLLEQGSAQQKAFAIAQVLVDEAKAIAATIAGATTAAAAGGPAAPFLLGAYIASGLATVAANFKRVKDILKTSQSSAAPQGTTAKPLSPVTESFTSGSDEIGGSMRVFVTEGDISKTQAKVSRNRNVSVI